MDVDVKQKFQFGGIGALFGYEIDLLVTPDPLYKPGLTFEPVFDYEQVLVVADAHRFANADYVTPEQLTDEVLITYPVETDRLDIYNQFLTPAGIVPRRHKSIETTDIIAMNQGHETISAVALDAVSNASAATQRGCASAFQNNNNAHAARMMPNSK